MSRSTAVWSDVRAWLRRHASSSYQELRHILQDLGLPADPPTLQERATPPTTTPLDPKPHGAPARPEAHLRPRPTKSPSPQATQEARHPDRPRRTGRTGPASGEKCFAWTFPLASRWQRGSLVGRAVEAHVRLRRARMPALRRAHASARYGHRTEERHALPSWPWRADGSARASAGAWPSLLEEPRAPKGGQRRPRRRVARTRDRCVSAVVCPRAGRVPAATNASPPRPPERPLRHLPPPPPNYGSHPQTLQSARLLPTLPVRRSRR